jgi:hypothetical protein
MNEKENLL